jgi:hypothetical protein
VRYQGLVLSHVNYLVYTGAKVPEKIIQARVVFAARLKMM